MHIERATVATQELAEALSRLIPQLTSRNPAPDKDALDLMLQSSTSVLLLARRPDAAGPIVGAAALGTYRVPTGLRAVIEDVVVDTGSRGEGIGEVLTRRLMEIAREMGAPGISLTSNPRREAANRLYVRLGFARRDTNLFYYAFA